VKLARKERQELQSLIRRTTAAQRDVTRARIALMAHEGYTSAEISQELGVSVQTVSKWRQRIARQRAQGDSGGRAQWSSAAHHAGDAAATDRTGV
jgi:transposase